MTIKPKSIQSNLIKARIIMAGWVMFVLLMFQSAGDIDGHFNPAAAPATITSVVANPNRPGWVTIGGTSARLRAGCSPRRLEWFRGERGNRDVSVQWDWGPPIVRADGKFEFLDWDVRVMPEEILTDETFANVIHQCRLFGFDLPWETRTHFFN
jgi:hypothetical protein